MISRVTAPATRTPVTATVAAVRTALATASPDWCDSWSTGGGLSGSASAAATRGFALAARRGFAPAFEPAAAAFAPPAFALAARAGFAAAVLPASAFTAALLAALDGVPAESRFALRFPGRERGRFPSTPSSSAMAGDSSPARSG